MVFLFSDFCGNYTQCLKWWEATAGGYTASWLSQCDHPELTGGQLTELSLR